MLRILNLRALGWGNDETFMIAQLKTVVPSACGGDCYFLGESNFPEGKILHPYFRTARWIFLYLLIRARVIFLKKGPIALLALTDESFLCPHGVAVKSSDGC